MKKLFTICILLLSYTLFAQPNPKVAVDINEKLYPVKDEDSYSSSEGNALIGATFMDNGFAVAEGILEKIKVEMKLQNIQAENFKSNDGRVLGVKGNFSNPDADDEKSKEMIMELYIIEIIKPAGKRGVILIMSHYTAADQNIFGAEGKKAVLSARLI